MTDKFTKEMLNKYSKSVKPTDIKVEEDGQFRVTINLTQVLKQIIKEAKAEGREEGVNEFAEFCKKELQTNESYESFNKMLKPHIEKVVKQVKKQTRKEVINEVQASARCIQFKGLKCDNKDCLRFICPLNHKFEEKNKNEVSK